MCTRRLSGSKNQSGRCGKEKNPAFADKDCRENKKMGWRNKWERPKKEAVAWSEDGEQ
jgi:hypothetical protein